MEAGEASPRRKALPVEASIACIAAGSHGLAGLGTRVGVGVGVRVRVRVRVRVGGRVGGSTRPQG